ncbi:hypothetical protein Bca4012_057818 [Brassica carinata]
MKTDSSNFPHSLYIYTYIPFSSYRVSLFYNPAQQMKRWFRDGSDDEGEVHDFSGKLFGMESEWMLILKSAEKSYSSLKRD